jgi:hypothetical protein
LTRGDLRVWLETHPGDGWVGVMSAYSGPHPLTEIVDDGSGTAIISVDYDSPVPPPGPSPDSGTMIV